MKKIIGILGNREKKVTSYIISEVLKRKGYVVRVMSCEDEKLKKTLKSKDDIDVLIIEIDLDNIEKFSKCNFHVDMIIDVDMTLDKYKEEKHLVSKLKLIETLKGNKLLIMNTDNKDFLKISLKYKGLLVITYGMNAKSSVTASSLDFEDKTFFNLCLQTNIKTIYDTQIEPFEYPMEMNFIGIENLYVTLASISALLYFDISLDIIAQTLMNTKSIKGSFEKIYKENFTVIDSYVRSPSDYNCLFHTVQNLDYKKLVIMNNISGDENEKDKEIAKIIKGWSMGINLKSFVTVVDFSNIYKPDHYKSLSKKDIDYSVHSEFESAIDHCLLKVERGDVFLILGNNQ